jgi:hypothetical protein
MIEIISVSMYHMFLIRWAASYWWNLTVRSVRHVYSKIIISLVIHSLLTKKLSWIPNTSLSLTLYYDNM